MKFQPTQTQVDEWKKIYDIHFNNRDLSNQIFNFLNRAKLESENKRVDFVRNTTFIYDDVAEMYIELNFNDHDVIGPDTITIRRRMVHVIGENDKFENYFSQIVRGNGSIQSNIERALASIMEPYIIDPESRYNLKVTVYTPEVKTIELNFIGQQFSPHELRTTLIVNNLLIHMVFHQSFQIDLTRED